MINCIEMSWLGKVKSILNSVFLLKLNKNLIYNILNLVSIFQYRVEKVYNYPIVIQARNWLYSIYRPSEIIVVDSNSYHTQYLNLCNVNNDILFVYDFIIYADYKEQDANMDKIVRVNKCIFYNLAHFDTSKPIEKTSYAFISIIVKIPGKGSYPLKFYSERENYYVVGNKINCLFIAYLLFQQYNLIIDRYPFNYEIELIDNNVKILFLTEKNTIILNENDYIVE
jgi:hypothetical protein